MSDTRGIGAGTYVLEGRLDIRPFAFEREYVPGPVVSRHNQLSQIILHDGEGLQVLASARTSRRRWYIKAVSEKQLNVAREWRGQLSPICGASSKM